MKALALARRVVQQLGGMDALTRLQRRVSRLDTHALTDWCDTAAVGVGRAFNDWQQDGNQDSLDEARMGTAALLVALEELKNRTAVGPS